MTLNFAIAISDPLAGGTVPLSHTSELKSH
jgi:hypothetical protein